MMILLSFSRIQTSKTAWSTIVLSFLPIQVLKKVPEDDTVVIFATFNAKKESSL